MIDGNNVYRRSVDRVLLSKVASRTQPIVAILSCSDCRVVPEKILGLSIGDAFVVRVAGNSASDSGVLGSLEYAVGSLRVPALLILGHTQCGAVKATLEGEPPTALAGVVRDIEVAGKRLSGHHGNNVDAVAEENVRLQMRRLSDNSSVIRDALASGELVMLGAMYDLATGAVRML